MKLSEIKITSRQQKDIEILIDTKLTHVLGGRKSKANCNFQIKFKVAAQFLHDFYEYFNINVYSDIRVVVLENIKEYILEWKPNINTRKEIEFANFKEGSK